MSKGNISVLALGNWGTAIANHLAMQGYSVLGWSANREVVKSINEKKVNPEVFSAITLNPALRATTDLNAALANKVIVMAFPSSALKEVVPLMKVDNDTLIISALKGIESETLKTPLQYVKDSLKEAGNMAVLSGPSFAIDLINSRPLGLVSASTDELVSRRVAEIFSGNNLKAYISTDPLGVELGGIVKNVIAIAVGVADGMQFGDSARAGLVTRGLAEMIRLSEAMGADTRTLSGLSGLGDLIMTASCDVSRNRTVGLRLGRGEKLDDIISSLGSVAEGVRTAPLILKLAEKYKIEMPIILLVTRFLRGEVGLQSLAGELLSRPTKREF